MYLSVCINIQEWEQGSNNHAFEVNFYVEKCSNLETTYKNEVYDLHQFHFHSPSEHTIGGAEYSAEVHFVHREETTGKIIVIGVLLEAVDSGFTVPNNAFLQTLFSNRTYLQNSLNTT